MNWKALQNGSDLRGVALEGVPGEEVNLTEDVVRRLGLAFSSWLAKTVGQPADRLRVAVGMDSRLSGPSLKKALLEGLTASGGEAGDAGLASTPALFMSTVLPGFEYDGAIMLTASHLPFNRNGLKFFTQAGGLGKRDISELLALAEATETAPGGASGAILPIELMAAYAADIVRQVRERVAHLVDFERPLEGLHVVVDAGNGAGGFFAGQVLEPLGARTDGSQFLEPDGHFPNHMPNPEDPAAMRSIREAVLDHAADFGVIFDTDVDRAAAVDEAGGVFNRNRLIGLIAAVVLEEHPGATIVTDSVTSDGLHTFIEEHLGGRHHRFKRGYKNVIDEAIRLNTNGEDAQLAIETSGHAAFKENYFLDDGCYLVTRLLVKLAQMKQSGDASLTSLVEPLPEPVGTREFRIAVRAQDFAAESAAVLARLESLVEAHEGWTVVPKNYEGLRVQCDADHGDGWFLLRASLHDPVLALNIESNRKHGVAHITEALLEFFNRHSALDTDALLDSA